MEQSRIRYSASAIETLDNMIDRFERLLGHRAEEIAVRDERRVVSHQDITRAWESMFADEFNTVDTVSKPEAPGKETATPVYEDATV